MGCHYGQANFFTYDFNPNEVKNKINNVRRTVAEAILQGYGVKLEETMDVSLLGDKLVLYDYVKHYTYLNQKGFLGESLRDRDQSCSSFSALRAREDFQKIMESCGFEEIKMKCQDMRAYILRQTCGPFDQEERQGCSKGLWKWAMDHARQGAITPSNAAEVLGKRNSIATELVGFRKRYMECLTGVREKIVNNGSRDINYCLDKYNEFSILRRKAAAEGCSLKAIEEYITQFELEVKKRNFAKIFQQIKNDYVMARTCTAKLLSAFNKLDENLDHYESSLQREMASTQREQTLSDRLVKIQDNNNFREIKIWN